MNPFGQPKHPDNEALPSYEAAIDRDPLPIIARYVESPSTLTSAIRVNRNWRNAFMGKLWSEPHRYWGLGSKDEMSMSARLSLL